MESIVKVGKRLPFWFGYKIISVHKNDGNEIQGVDKKVAIIENMVNVV